MLVSTILRGLFIRARLLTRKGRGKHPVSGSRNGRVGRVHHGGLDPHPPGALEGGITRAGPPGVRDRIPDSHDRVWIADQP